MLGTTTQTLIASYLQFPTITTNATFTLTIEDFAQLNGGFSLLSQTRRQGRQMQIDPCSLPPMMNFTEPSTMDYAVGNSTLQQNVNFPPNDP